MVPADPARSVVMGYTLIVGYLCYSIVLALALRWTDFVGSHSAAIIHAFDLLIFLVFMFLRTALTAPFFAFFVFFIVSGTLRWHWRGIVFTVAIAVVVEIALVAYTAGPSWDLRPAISRSIFHIGLLLVVAAFLSYFSIHERQQRDKIKSLASWPRTIPGEIYPLMSEILQRASSLLTAPRTLLIWKEEESTLYTALWSGGQFHHSIESPDTFGSLIAEPLAGLNFFCRNSLASMPWVLYNSPIGFQRWQGQPLHPELQRRFSIKFVLSLDLQSENGSGRLFALDNERMTSDDLMLGKIVSNEVLSHLDQFYLQKRIKQVNVAEERIHLARDLHDGLLQSLTGIVLQLETAHQLMEKDPEKARQRLQDIQKIISSEQQNLRLQIRQLKPPYSSLPEWDGDLPRRLKEMAGHIEYQWGLHVDMEVDLQLTRIPWAMSQCVYFIVREAMINAARHAMATSMRAKISSTDHQLQIVVTDDGHGFPFSGRHDNATLAEKKLGPIILRERIASLGGRLAIESSRAGARLEIQLPIPENMN